MVTIVSEFVVRAEARGPFELAYGPGGAWSRLFARAAGFRGITLLRETGDPNRYMMFESWDSEAHRARAVGEQESEYRRLEAALAEWTESRTEMGTFRVVTEASVRPQPGARRA